MLRLYFQLHLLKKVQQNNKLSHRRKPLAQRCLTYIQATLPLPFQSRICLLLLRVSPRIGLFKFFNNLFLQKVRTKKQTNCSKYDQPWRGVIKPFLIVVYKMRVLSFTIALSGNQGLVKWVTLVPKLRVQHLNLSAIRVELCKNEKHSSLLPNIVNDSISFLTRGVDYLFLRFRSK